MEELDEWTGILEPRPMLAHDMREGPGPPMFVDVGDRWDDWSWTAVLLPFHLYCGHFSIRDKGSNTRRLTIHELWDALDVDG